MSFSAMSGDCPSDFAERDEAATPAKAPWVRVFAGPATGPAGTAGGWAKGRGCWTRLAGLEAGPDRRLEVRVRPGRQQLPDDRLVPVRGCPAERRPPLVLRLVRIGAVGEQEAHHVRVPPAGCGAERRPLPAGPGTEEIRVCPGPQE